jgi:5-methylcytosine-specific restriction endonuclease McrA
MARIRTIKPEFWTDETIVKLPFIARLLFIGMWNFSDDSGVIEFSPDRLQLQILPSEKDCDITGLIDLLEAAGLVAYWVSDEGTVALSINGWAKHQKIDNPSRKTILREDYRKKAIPSESRLAVAKKYGCPPGGEVDASCYYCGMPGKVKWWASPNGKPTRWVTLSDLEFDHFISEHSGGPNTGENLVLACRCCNRGKREFDPHQFFAKKNPRVALDSAREGYALDQGSRIKDQGVDQGPGEDQGSNPLSSSHSTAAEIEQIFGYWQKTMDSPTSKLDDKRRKAIKAALAMNYAPRDLCRAIRGCSLTPHNMGQNDRGQKYNGIALIFRSADQIDRFIANELSPPRQAPPQTASYHDERAATIAGLTGEDRRYERDDRTIDV